MRNDDHPDKAAGTGQPGLMTRLLHGLIRDTVGLWITLLIGTAAGAAICLYLGAPLIYSLLGGVLVMAVYVAWDRL
jgi:hypothetical protein